MLKYLSASKTLSLLTVLLIASLLQPIIPYDKIILKDRSISINRSISVKKEKNLSLELDNRLLEEINDKRKSIFLTITPSGPLNIKLGSKYRSIGDGKILEISPLGDTPQSIIVIDSQNKNLWKRIKETSQVFLNFQPEHDGVETEMEIIINVDDRLSIELNKGYRIITEGRKSLKVKSEFSSQELERKLKAFFKGDAITLKGSSVAGYGALGEKVPSSDDKRFMLTKFEEVSVGHIIYADDPQSCKGPRCHYSFNIKLKNVPELNAGIITSKNTETFGEEHTTHDYLSSASFQTYKYFPPSRETLIFTLKIAEGDANLYVNPGFDERDQTKYLFSNKGKGVKRIVIEEWKLRAMNLRKDSVSYILSSQSSLKLLLIPKQVTH